MASSTSLRHAVLAAALLSVAIVLLGWVGPPSGPSGPARAEAACPPHPSSISPRGSRATRFTMFLRLNHEGNLAQYANANEATGGLRNRVKSRDLFLINTRDPDLSPAEAHTLATKTRQAFPCNRIVALNGFGANPTAPGYAFALINHPSVHALLLDWEPGDWNLGRATDPARPFFTFKFRRTLKRVRGWMGALINNFAAVAARRGKRAGLVPISVRHWDYGKLAKTIDSQNRRLGRSRHGLQSVQTQAACQQGAAGGFKRRATRIFKQYKLRKKRKKGSGRKAVAAKRKRKKRKPSRRSLSLQISFSDSPTPGDPMPIRSVSAGRAAGCTAAALKAGGGAFLYWATPQSMRLLFNTPQIRALRP